MKILITGAGGFLGQAAVEEALRAGHAVRAWARARPADASADWGSAEFFQGDLRDFKLHAAAMAGMDAVIHCAAVTSAGRTDAALSRQVNVEALKSLHAAARGAGVTRWIEISSMSAHPGSSSVYGRTKLEGDEYLRQSAAPPAWTILRPSLIYGPGARGLVAKTLGLLKKIPVLPMLGSGRERIRPVYVTDVARAALQCLAEPATAGKTYMLGGADEIELREFMRRMTERAGLKRPFFPIPLPLAMLLAKGLALLTATPPISVDNVQGVREAQRVDHEAAAREFGFQPMGVDAGLTKTFER